MSDRRFFTETGRRWEGRVVSGRGVGGWLEGVVTVETVSNHTVISHRQRYTRARYCTVFCSKTNTFPSLLMPPVPGSGCQGAYVRLLQTLLPESTHPRVRGVWKKIIWWGDVGLISRKMLLLPHGPAVLFPRRALKLLKLTYYLLDWANMFVFCVHVCASAWSPPIFPSS